MNRYEAIIKALEQCERMFKEQGEWTGDEYMEMVLPLHEALKIDSASTDQRGEENVVCETDGLM